MPMSSQGTKVYLSASQVATPITAVTKAEPAVVTSTGVVTAVGDYVFIQNTGFASIDRKIWEVEAIAIDAVTLKGSDTSGETGNMIAGGTLTTSPDLIEICLASLTRDSPAAATLDVTTLCDDERQQRSGMKNNGTWTSQGFYDYSEPGRVRLLEAYDAGDPRLMQIVAPDKSKILYNTQVNQLGEAFAVDQPVQAPAGGIIMGRVVYVRKDGTIINQALATAAAPAQAAA